jgi:signal transduction histidine kinase
MKLFHKIFLCFVLLFGIAFQAAGLLLVNYAYGNALEQEKKYAFQEFQQNKYILQSILYLEPELFEDGAGSLPDMAGRFTVPVSLFSEDGVCIFSNTGMQPDFLGFQGEADDRIAFRIFREGEESDIFVYGCIEQGDRKVCMLTETDISSVVDAQKSMIAYFQKIYIAILCISFPVIFLLTRALTSSIKKVGKAAGRIAKGNYSERIGIEGKDEISELASDFNRMAQQVEEKVAALSDVARQKEDFAANFAHELKTPLTSVIGYADMLYRRELSKEDVKSAAEYILSEGMRLESLSLKLMDLFVLDKQDFLLERMSVREMFENLAQGVEPVCRKHGAALHMEMQDSMIAVDYDLFKTMILNLVDNAVKADCRDVWISGTQGRNIYRIRISDNGKGIPPKELGRITEAFYMVDKSRSRKQHGAGLGMALVSKIVKIHRAEMAIESDGKTGTAISIGFPLYEGGADEGNL